ncbi:major facilitator superfamily protein [Stylonychia lemnae]|uniref:Major facilitator superfamily protein n=1 Tax=Stylonychia lemnae TaxID=5949 RepID=A0A078AIV6_STYLE|nr:major facilitator superfamily protein [Stylonychia lemnae]|eukprot:CDW81861.1 major facilitator superfamily protein [Stylonychia lemnae]
MFSVTVLSMGFFMIYLADNTTMNLSSVILSKTGFGEWGFYYVALYFLFLGIGSIFSMPIILFLGEKLTIVISASTVCLWVICYSLPAYKNDNPNSDQFFVQESFIKALIFLTTFLYGFLSGPLWVCQGLVLSKYATQSTKGFYNSFFFSFFMASQVFGNLIAALVLSASNVNRLFQILAGIALVGAILFLFLRRPTKIESQQEQQDEIQSTQDINEPQLNEGRSKRKCDCSKYLKETYEMIISKKLLYVIPMIIYSGISLAIGFGIFVQFLVQTMESSNTYSNKESDQLKYAMLGMMVYGIGQVSGGIIQGLIIDKKGYKVSVIVCAVLLKYIPQEILSNKKEISDNDIKEKEIEFKISI